MPVSTDLQDMLADVSAAIAKNKPLGRADLEVMRRRLNASITDLRVQERTAGRAARVADDLIAGISKGTLNLSGLADRARQQLGAK